VPKLDLKHPLALGLAWLVIGLVPTQAPPQTSSSVIVPPPPAAQDPAIQREAPDSPRAAMRRFLEAAERGDYLSASRYLSLDPKSSAHGADVARRLYDVIRRRVVIDLDSISPLSEGDVNDAEPPLQDRVGVMFGAGGVETHPIVLQRVSTGGANRWLVASQSVAALDSVYPTLTDSWAEGRLPAPLLEAGPFGFPRWKWAGIVLAIPVVWLLTLLIAHGLRRAAEAVTRRTPAVWDDELVVRLRGPVRLFLASVLALPVLMLLELDASVAVPIWRVLRGITIVSVFWMLLRLIGVAQDHLARMAWASDHTNAQTIVPLIGRSLRVALGLLALLVAFSQFGYPVGTLLAGLGIGGIVVALAAQKTVENLFGSVTLAADRVFRVGDWVKFEDVQGTVERIGLRSTHVRTLDRTLVKIPNGRLADLRIESFGERDRIRFFTTVRLVYDTTAAQLREVLQGIETLLRSHPRVWPDGISVRLVGLGQYSLDVNVNAWFATIDWGEFELIRQEVLLTMMEIVERAGTHLAMPMQVLRIEEDGSEAREALADGRART
jgi:MscS family membrane protein